MGNPEKAPRSNQEALRKGHIISVEAGFWLHVQLPERYVRKRSKSDKLTWAKIRVGQMVEDLDTTSFTGEYIVTSVQREPGGHGHSLGDVYPDYFVVYCQQLHPDGSLGAEAYFLQALNYPSSYGPDQVHPSGEGIFHVLRLR